MNTSANKWVLVTGGARRIGRAIALELAAQGFDIILHYNQSADDAAQTAKEIEKLGRQVALAEIDLARSDLVAKLIPSLSSALGPITALVNNASLFELDASDPDGNLHRSINADAPRILSEALFAQLPAGQTGAIVNILDGTPPSPHMNAYGRSKTALKNYTLTSAASMAPRIRVNGIAPGPTLPSARQSEQNFQAQVDATPSKKKADPEDIARAVHSLLTSPSITGDILYVDGGGPLKTVD